MTYFQRHGTVGAIFGAFFLLFVPLALLELRPNAFGWFPHVVLLEAVGLGVTHFFITLFVYLDRDNLRHFAGSLKNGVVYFAVPALVRAAPGTPSPHARALENAFFVGLALLQWETFLMGGRFLASDARAVIPAAALLLLFLYVEWALDLAEGGDHAAALLEFEKAGRLDPENPALARARQAVELRFAREETPE